MPKIKVGHFTGTAAAINLDLGFVPDYFKLFSLSGNTDTRFYEWFNRMEGDTPIAAYLEGVGITEGGVTADLATTEGISAYNDAAVQYMIDAPSGDKKQIAATTPTVIPFATGTDYSGGTFYARTGLIIGSVVLPITPNGFCYELLTKTAAGTTEPTWPTIPGQTVLDGGANLWCCRTIALKHVGFEGVTIAAALTEDGIEAFYLAIKADEDSDHGDAASF